MGRILTYLRPFHYQAMEMRLKGASMKDIAETFNRSEHTVRNWFYQDDVFKEEYAKKVEHRKFEIEQTFANEAKTAQQVLLGLFSDQDSRVKLAAVKDWLDRAGYKPTDKSEVKLDGEITSKQGFDDKLLNDPEAVEAMKKLFEKMSDDE